MKNVNILSLLVGLFLVSIQSLLANDDRYLEAMQKNIQTVYTAETIPDLQQGVNALERIASAEKTKWEPYYYAGFGYIIMATREQESGKKDLFLDQAIAAIEKAKAINGSESEIIALEGFALMIRVTVDPATRGPQYSGLAMQTFGKASALNPANPRPLALLAQMQYGTAKFLGSPTTEACSTLDISLEKFETYKSENPLSPQWGKEMALGLKKECK
jgi:hypothetical protein